MNVGEVRTDFGRTECGNASGGARRRDEKKAARDVVRAAVLTSGTDYRDPPSATGHAFGHPFGHSGHDPLHVA
jgi:hypothetical protein